MSRHPIAVYSAARIAVFVVAAGLLWLAGTRGLLFLALSLLVSGLASYVLLRAQRDAMALAIAERAQRTRQRLDSAAAAEDDEL